MPTLIVATANKNKVKEFSDILSCYDSFRILSAKDFPDAPYVVENGKTFYDNAGKKATQFAFYIIHLTRSHKVNLSYPIYILADDSGLEVDYLNGAPGVNSARFASVSGANNSTDEENNKKLLSLLNGVPDEKRTARFKCVLAVVEINNVAIENIDALSNRLKFFESICEGRIINAPRGSGGFGYDPLFVPNGYDRTFAELGEELKNKISHRALALKSFIQWLKETKPTK